MSLGILTLCWGIPARLLHCLIQMMYSTPFKFPPWSRIIPVIIFAYLELDQMAKHGIS